MSVATSVVRGDNIVGLQPDDRMPNDWLRMVARVFAAYRLTPLETSIVAYIDGFHLSTESFNPPEAIIGITDGQSFIDDQFIGFNNDPDIGELVPESTITLDVNAMKQYDAADPDNTEYVVVLCYTWVNIMPPQKPNFDIVLRGQLDPEHMLELGILRYDGTDLELIDDKRMWFWDLLQMFIGDTEIDGPASNRADSKTLPYLIAVKENETMDIGWALDFHCEAGKDADNDANGEPINHHDKDVRLSVKSPLDYNDPLNPGPLPGSQACDSDNLYINDRPILTAPDENSPNIDAHDPGCNMNSTIVGQDKFGAYHANLRLVDSSTVHDGYYNAASNSEYINLELATYHPGVNSNDWSGDNSNPHGTTLSHWHKEHETHLINYHNFDNPCAIINDFRLGSQPFDVTINNKQILTYNDFPGGVPPELIFFIGKFPSAPLERYPNDSRYEQIKDGDMYYHTIEHAYYFWENDKWTMVGSNAPVRGHSYSLISNTNQQNFPTAAGTMPDGSPFVVDPDFMIVSRAGLTLTPIDDYTVVGDTNTVTQIKMVQPCEKDERITVYTINVGSGRLRDITKAATLFVNGYVVSEGQDTFNVSYNPDWEAIYIDGLLMNTDDYDDSVQSEITFTNGTTAGQIIQAVSLTESEGRLDLKQSGTIVATSTGTENITYEYNPYFVMVYVNGIQLPKSRYNASNGVSVDVYNMTPDDNVRIYSVIDVEGLNNFKFYQDEEIITAGDSPKTQFNFNFDPGFTVVSVDGLVLRLGIEYTLDNGLLNLTVPAIEDQVVKMYSMVDEAVGTQSTATIHNMNTGTSVGPSSVAYKSEEFTGDGSETDFRIDAIFDKAPVHINGSRVRPGVDYTLIRSGNSTTVSFEVAPENGDWIIVDYVQ